MMGPGLGFVIGGSFLRTFTNIDEVRGTIIRSPSYCFLCTFHSYSCSYYFLLNFILARRFKPYPKRPTLDRSLVARFCITFRYVYNYWVPAGFVSKENEKWKI